MEVCSGEVLTYGDRVIDKYLNNFVATKKISIFAMPGVNNAKKRKHDANSSKRVFCIHWHYTDFVSLFKNDRGVKRLEGKRDRK